MTDVVWTQVTVKVPAAMEDAVADTLTTLTGRGVRLGEGKGGSVIDAYLSPAEREELVLRISSYLDDLVHMGLLPEGTRPTLTEVPEEDWMEVFRSQHGTIRISPRLVVRPTWCSPEDGREVVIDPGMAFGTGSHPTTRQCLVLLDKAVGHPPPHRMLDLGTGSGILAIAGAFLGIGDVLALDIDPVAVEVASRNAELNGVADRIRVAEGGVDAAGGRYDLVTANLSGPLLKRLAGSIAFCTAPGGQLILSGILEDEWEGIREAFLSRGLQTRDVQREKVWVAALLGSPRGDE